MGSHGGGGATQPTYDELLDENRRLRAEVDRLQARLDELTQQLETATAASKRQAAPFRKGPPKPNPKTPGRKPGDAHGTHGHRPPPPPEQVSECLEASLPDDCPHCHGPLVETEIADQYQTEIPRQPIVRQFHVHIGQCQRCGKRVQGRHPLQTSDALGAAASQIGPDAQAAAVLLNKEAGLSHGKVAAVFDTLFGIDLSRGASAQINLRAAARLEPDYQRVLEDLPDCYRLAVDETGWRVGGKSAWLHVWVGEQATCYAIDSQRSAAVLEQELGLDWAGVLSHDGFASYDRFEDALHQQCLAHVLRRARGLLKTAVGGAAWFPRRVIALLTEAIHWRNRFRRGEVPLSTLQSQRLVFDERLQRLTARRKSNAANERLAAHLERHQESWFEFLTDPQIEATNWEAEQAIRPAVVNRKVWGGNRTWAGAKAQSVLMTVLATCRRQARSALDYVSETLRSFGHWLIPHPTLLPTR
jgi:transposase